MPAGVPSGRAVPRPARWTSATAAIPAHL